MKKLLKIVLGILTSFDGFLDVGAIEFRGTNSVSPIQIANEIDPNRSILIRQTSLYRSIKN